MFWVYILRSRRNGKLYVGHTDDLTGRLAEHNAGRGGQFTRQNGPWELAYSEQQPDRPSATARERFLKSVSGSREKNRLAGVAVADAAEGPSEWPGLSVPAGRSPVRAEP